MIRKVIFIILALFTLITLTSCKENNLNGNSISQYKNYDKTTSKFDYVAFGIQHHETSSLANIGLSEEEIEFVNKPLGKNLELLTRIDIINLGILNESQLKEFNVYCDKTKSNHFKLSFIIPNDQNANDYGMQIIDITNLDYLSEKQINQGFSYHLYFESKKLNLNQITEEAEKVLAVDNISKLILNDTFAGIYLHNYSVKDDKVTLRFYVIYANLVTSNDEINLDYAKLKWFEIDL